MLEKYDIKNLSIKECAKIVAEILNEGKISKNYHDVLASYNTGKLMKIAQKHGWNYNKNTKKINGKLDFDGMSDIEKKKFKKFDKNLLKHINKRDKQ